MSQITEAIDVVPNPAPPLPGIAREMEIRYYTASQFQLMWWKFKKHRLALIGMSLLAVFIFIALFAEFLSPSGPTVRTPNYLFGSPQVLHFVDAEGKFHLRPFTYALTAAMDPQTFLLEVKEDTSEPWPVYFFVKGDPYKMWGLIESDVHLFGVQEGHLHLLGTDQLGRDILSRLFHATRTSLTIGVVGLIISFFLGLIIGGISGFFGGGIDDAIQRFIEFIRSIPTLPLWMALAAALPKEWSPQRVYFTITILLGLLGWTHLARRVRGKLLSLREEDFVVAARIAGSSNSRIIARHLLPSFLSYIIVDLSISFPYMILAETSLSFIGLGLRAPVISWGTLLQDAQNIQAIALYPWLFTPVAFVIISVMAFSFVGDGMRDAADPYSR
jgi:peptide/nickel transport system permease protein